MHKVENLSDSESVTIKELRINFGITQAQLSEMTGIPVRTISKWESGCRTPAPYIAGLIRAKLESEIQRS